MENWNSDKLCNLFHVHLLFMMLYVTLKKRGSILGNAKLWLNVTLYKNPMKYPSKNKSEGTASWPTPYSKVLHAKVKKNNDISRLSDHLQGSISIQQAGYNLFPRAKQCSSSYLAVG